ncbi:hypothetical protein XH88_09315 [Bradyrhizobium sp. CCBAU 51627]|nr:hypothetical protein [Bradyrhizobium sp. CCBAU 51627]
MPSTDLRNGPTWVQTAPAQVIEIRLLQSHYADHEFDVMGSQAGGTHAVMPCEGSRDQKLGATLPLGEKPKQTHRHELHLIDEQQTGASCCWPFASLL